MSKGCMPLLLLLFLVVVGECGSNCFADGDCFTGSRVRLASMP